MTTKDIEAENKALRKDVEALKKELKAAKASIADATDMFKDYVKLSPKLN